MIGLDNSVFAQEALACFDKLLPIYSNPGYEQDMYATARELFVELGFVDYNLPLLVREYQIHHRLTKNDRAIYSRKVPNLGLGFVGDDRQPTYFFNAHLDHYFSGAVTTRMMYDGEWLISDGKNLLAADCKMGIAIIYAWVKRMLSWDVVPNIEILFDTCEEPGLVGANEFVEHKMYQDMSFFKNYRNGKSVYAYSLDGAWSENIGNKNHCYVTRAFALSISQYLNKNIANKICAVEGDKIYWRNLKKKEKSSVACLENVCPGLDLNSVEVFKFGAAFVLLNKVIPCVMLPVGFVDYHTKNERYWLPYLNVHEKKFKSASD